MKKKNISYRQSGVSIAANDALVTRIWSQLRRTQDHRVLDNPNGFAGFFRLNDPVHHYRKPVLVGCCDGVGSKVLIAARMNRLNTVGIDLVAMNVNDLVTCGAEPLFFLDYVAVNKNTPARTAQLVAGVADGCLQAGCTLLGGETAEMPAVYKKKEFDLAGFAVGVVEEDQMITGRDIQPGDVVIGLASSGLHSNGFALVRKIFFDAHRYKLTSRIKGLRRPLGEELLVPTRIYSKLIYQWLKKNPGTIQGLAHITGGGLPGNVPRILPRGCQAMIDTSTWQRPPIFQLIQSLGVQADEMYQVFNMGIGLVAIVRPAVVKSLRAYFTRQKFESAVIGCISKGRNQLLLVEPKTTNR
ncbi:MAG: Phosphoribosylformylglycinamidine cyclo-ligase [Phycisphaerae bacterium]|nr:Phosphoribosylformylglycinamidine cyclo-ligase [Phycisphaerae bacterium]